MMKKKLLFVLFLCVACSSPNDSEEIQVFEELTLGQFKGEVGENPNSGLYEELAGRAQFQLDPADTTFSFILTSTLNSNTSSTEIILTTKSLVLPQTGTFTFNNIDETSQVFSSGFSGFYLSPTAGLGQQYYSESGTLTITSSEEENGIAGYFEAVIFYKAITGENDYTRQYSTINGQFNAAPMNLR